jgi:hypothetical protein
MPITWPPTSAAAAAAAISTDSEHRAFGEGTMYCLLKLSMLLLLLHLLMWQWWLMPADSSTMLHLLLSGW